MLPHFFTPLTLAVSKKCRINKNLVVTIIAFGFSFLFTSTVCCQSPITRVEYYIDNDPGFGRATAIAISPGTDIANLIITVNPETITEGVHRLYVRAKNANENWSLTNTLLFYKPYGSGTIPPGADPPSNISRVEYYLDNDPGFGAATPLAFTAGTDIQNSVIAIDPALVSEGVHRLYVRAKNTNGNWSLTNTLLFYKPYGGGTMPPGTDPPSNISRVEYYLDNDPGFGAATPLTFSAATDIQNGVIAIDPALISEGVHRLSVRAKNANGKWSLTNTLLFYKPYGNGVVPPAPLLSKLNLVEYYINIDPGFGNGVPVSFQPGINITDLTIPVDISGLAIGDYTMCVRAKDSTGDWSMTNKWVFRVDSISQPAFTVGKITPNLCAGNPVSVPVNVNAEFGSDNIFTAQLSNDAGNFSNPVNIGTLSATSSDTIKATIPANTPAGYNYRIRVIASAPEDTTDYNDTTITVLRVPEQSFTLVGKSSVCTGSEIYSVSSIDTGVKYTWTLSEELTLDTTATTATINWDTAGLYTLTATPSNACGNGPSKTFQIRVFGGIPAITPVITVNGRILSATGATAQEVSGYQWYKDGSVISGATDSFYNALLDGTYTLKFTNACGTGSESAPVNLGANKLSQSITFDAPNDIMYGGAPLNLFATATSGLPISFSVVSGPATISGKTLTPTGVGTVTVRATQTGNISFDSATSVIKSLCVKISAHNGISGLQRVCPGSDVYTTPFILGTTYTWSVTGGARKNDSANTAKITFTSAGTYDVIVQYKGGCDTASFVDTTIVVVAAPVTPGAVSNTLPADSIQNITLPVNLSWSPAINADHYDVYLWVDSLSKPANPFISNTTDINVSVGSGLENRVYYRWQVVSKNTCRSTNGPSQVFAVNNTVDDPDLVVTNVQHSANATAGQSLTLSWTVSNVGIGSTNSSQWSDYVYLSTDKDLRIGDDILIEKFNNQSFLQPGQSYTQTKTLTLPGQYTGTYYLFVITDNRDAYCWAQETCDSVFGPRGSHDYGLHESKENNNYQFSLITINYGSLADLRVVSLATPSTVFGGNNINVTYGVTNTGTIAAVGTTIGSCPQRGWYDRVFISPDSVFNRANSFEFPSSGFFRGDELINCKGNTSYRDYLSPESSYSRAHAVQIPYTYYGTYFIYVMTNGYDEAYEGPYNNNNILRSDPITVNLTPPADLVVSRVQVPSTALSGQQISINFTVTNNGANAPREYYWTDSIYLSTQNVFNPANVTRLLGIGHSNSFPLGPDSSYSVTQQVTLPNGISGTYYVLLRTDGENKVFEYNNDNNNGFVSTPISVTLAPVVDLTVTKISAPDSVNVDSSFIFRWNVKNQGVAASPDFTDYIFCSQDSSLTSANLYSLGSYVHTGTFPAGTESTFVATISVPAAFGGKKVYFFVITDYINRVYEHMAEDNNRGTSTAPQSSGDTYVKAAPVTALVVLKPDIKVQSFTAPSSALSGTIQTISWQVTNGGQGSVPVNNWTDYVLLSTDSIFDGGDQILLTSPNNVHLPPGGSYNKSANIQLPYPVFGNYYLFIFTDLNNSVYNDSLRRNNVAASPVTITLAPGADIVINSVDTLTSPVYAGSQFYLKYSVTNSGSVATNVSNWYDGVYFNTSQIPSGSQSGSKQHTGVLNPGQSYNDSVLVTVPSYLSGNYYFILRTDNSSNVYEGSAGESNNISARAVNIQPLLASKSDLIVSALTVPDSALLGKAIEAGYTVKNIGSNPALNLLTNAFYLSANKTYEGSVDQLVKASASSVVLNPGDSLTGTLTGAAVVPLAGDYYGIIRANILNTVSEDSINNNTKTSNTSVYIDALALTLNVTKIDTVIPSYVSYYKVDVNSGLDLLVTLTSGLSSSAGTNTLYIAYDRVPTVYDYDAEGIDAATLNQQLLLSGTHAGTYYIRVESKNINTNEPVTVRSQTLPFSILKLTPSVAGQYFVSADLYGAGFKDSSKVYLKTSSGAIVSQATVAMFVNSTRLKLKWDLRSVPIGSYDVVVVNPDASLATLQNGMTVQTSSGYVLDFVPLMPNQIRTNQTGLFSFKATNNGNINIPFVHGDFTLPGYVNIKNVMVEGKVRKQSQYYPDTTRYKRPDYYEQGNTKIIPFIAKDLAPGEEFTITFYLSNFTQHSFPIRPRVFGYSTNEFARQQIGKLEILREAILQRPSSFGLTNQSVLLIKASDRDTFIHGMLNNYYEAGFLTPADVVGIDPSCPACLLQIDTATLSSTLGYTFNSGPSPALATFSHDTTFAGGESYLFKINKSLYWPSYTGSVGVAGQDLGWDLLKVNGKLNITSSSANPFTINIASLSYRNRPAMLAGWYPAKDTSFEMIIATQGIQNFSADKFIIDATLFQRYNNTYGGYFYLRLNKSAFAGGPDTLFLGFKAHIPRVGEAGVPGAPGVEGEPGSPGGNGGPGDGMTPPGDGGFGGNGGNGAPGGGAGGDGGSGGTGGTGGAGQNGGDGGSGGSGGNGGSGGGNGGNGGNGGSGGSGGSSGNGGNGGGGGNSGGGSGSGGGGGAGGSGSSGGSSGDPGGGGSGDGGGGTNCSENNKGDEELCEDLIDLIEIANSDDFWKDLGWFSAGKLAGDNCVAGSFLSCAEGALDALWDVVTIDWWGAGTDALSCGLKIGDCINQGIYGTKDYPGSYIVEDLQNGVECIRSLSGVAKCAAKKVLCTPVVSSCDPNEIIGPPSYGAALMVSNKATLAYSIHFENDSINATTAAQKVVIKQSIHPNLNPLSFRIGNFSFGNRTFNIGQPQSSYFTVLDLSDSLGYNVEVTAGVDVVNRELVWVFQTIDPATGLPPANPLVGFLPVNNARGAGQGYVTYIIKPELTTATGDSITTKANIFFDTNDPIPTNEWLNTIDAGNPKSRINTIEINDTTITLKWMGEDDLRGSGVKDYALYYSENNGAFNLYQQNIPDTIIRFIGTPGKTYCFVTEASDNTGNKEAFKTGCDATVEIPNVLPITWLYFNRSVSGKDVILNWATTTEINSNFFAIERSFDGINFTEIGILQAAGNSTWANNYSYIDREAMTLRENALYYRLRQVDINGKFAYSVIVSIRMSQSIAEPLISAYPNPFKQKITLKIITVTPTDRTDAVLLYAMDGKLLYSNKILARGNATILLDDLPQLKQGVYLLKTSVSGKLFTLKMIKQ